MAKLATLIDDFQDGVIDPSLWTSEPGVTETAGRVKIVPSTSHPALLGLLPRTYDLTSSQIVAHIPVVTSNGSTGSLQCAMVVDAAGSNAVSIRKVGSDLICTKEVAGVQTNLSFNAYSAVNHLFWRIRCDASNIYFETSPNGTGYFVQYTTSLGSLGFSVSTVGAYFFAGYSGVEAFPGTFQIEAVNPGLPITSAATSTSTGSLSLQKVSPLSLTGNAASTSTGSLAFTLVAAPAIYLSFHGSSTSTGHLTINALATGSLTFAGASTSSGSLSLTIPAPPATLPGGTWFFEPPIAYDLPPTLPDPRPRYLNAHAKWKGGQRRGRTVLKITSDAAALFPSDNLFPSDSLYPSTEISRYVTVDTPTVDQIAAAKVAYQGGHIYEITAEEAYNLQLAGFSVYHGTDLLTTESGDFITTEAGDIIEVEYSFGSS